MIPRPHSDAVAGIVLMVTGGIAIASARTLPSVPGGSLGPSSFPTVLGAALVMGGLVLLIQARRQPAGHSVPSSPPPASGRLHAVVILGALLGAGLLLPILGFFLTATGFLAIALGVQGAGWHRMMLAPLIAGGAFLGFSEVLKVMLPPFGLW